MIDLELNKPENTKIPAIEEWFHTGILLLKNCTYKFEVIPPDQVWYDGKTLKPFTADGRLVPHLLLLYPLIRMPSAKWFSLIGCINKKRSSYFKIGTLRNKYSPDKDGELICFSNDALHFYKHNNSGEIELTITKTKQT